MLNLFTIHGGIGEAVEGLKWILKQVQDDGLWGPSVQGDG
jgi:hypothetical protein